MLPNSFVSALSADILQNWGCISTWCGYFHSGRIARFPFPVKISHSPPPFANSMVSKGLVIFPKLLVLT